MPLNDLGLNLIRAEKCIGLRDGPFDIQWGGGEAGIFLKKNSLFPNRGEKNKMSSMKLKIKSLFFIQYNFSKTFSLGAIKICK